MTLWDVVALSILVFVSNVGLGALTDLLAEKFGKRKPRVRDSTVVYLDEWRERSDPPKSS